MRKASIICKVDSMDDDCDPTTPVLASFDQKGGSGAILKMTNCNAEEFYTGQNHERLHRRELERRSGAAFRAHMSGTAIHENHLAQTRRPVGPRRKNFQH